VTAPTLSAGAPADLAEWAREVRALAEQRDAVILAHNYQVPQIQDVAHHVGDSLALSRIAATAPQSTIVFCGVHFMAETAKILSPEKTVLIPDANAGCSLADSLTADELRAWKAENPGAVVVSYVNTTAEVKAETDICCTSSNAVQVAAAVEGDTILFVPDRNLANFVAGQVDKEIIPWEGYCPVHDEITVENVLDGLAAHPEAEVVAHPECRREVLAVAHHVRSTSGMVDAALASPADEFIVATEAGMLYPLEKAVPGKRFHSPAGEHICPNMKLITLSKVLWALQTLEPRVTVPEDVRVRALGAVERMLALG